LASALLQLLRPLAKPTNLLALLVFGVVLLAGAYASTLNAVLYEQSERADVFKELSVIGARLEGNINRNLALARGLVATIETEPGMDAERFAELAEGLFQPGSQLRDVAGAPDFVVNLLYPIQGNEKVLGLDYRDNESQRLAAEQARDQRSLVFTGPVDLVQGGRGFVGRFPVLTRVPGPRNGTFWGIVSAVIDSDALYAASGLSDPGLSIAVAITRTDSRVAEPFYGTSAITADRPVMATVLLPSETWQLSAVPKQGWQAAPPNAPLIWGGFTLLGLIITVPIVLRGLQLDERQRNLSEIRAREAELQRLSRRLRLALEASQVGVWEYDLDAGELIWDDRVHALFGVPADGTPRRLEQWRAVLHPDDLARAEAEFDHAINVSGRYHSDYRIVTPSGTVRHIRAIAAVYQDPGQNRKVVGVDWDVTADVALNDNLKARAAELEAAKAAIEFNALHDALTGLPNRRYLDQMLHGLAERAAAEGCSLTLLHIDLDRFKQINDTLGHAAGDVMLVHVAGLLKANIRSSDFVARIGGDEFVVASLSDGDEAPIARLADRIIGSMHEPVIYEGHECRTGVSVGIATAAGAEIDPPKLLINADIALYKAKRRGRNRHEFFSEELQAEVVRTKRLADEILAGLEQHQFEAWYQPQFDARTLDVVGVEALARWRHPERGLLAPAAFFDVAEELNVVSSIDREILEQAVQKFDAWEAAGLGVPRVSVNVSAHRLQDERLAAALKTLRFRPGTLSFELVESIFLDETDDLMLFAIEHIKELGIDIEVDDFGTGYASIISLIKLKPRRLKIDRQLIDPIVTDAAQRQLVRSIVENGRLLGIEVVGEGVETPEHVRILRDMGCEILQGFALARPMPASELPGFLRDQPWRRVGIVPAPQLEQAPIPG
jgi:diguanylate cyclase (GGDEF)-like protein